MRHGLLLMGAAAAIAFSGPARAQYMYIDVDGDGLCESSDVLTPGTASFDVWLDTTHDMLGNPATCRTGPEELTINSYTIALGSENSAVGFDSWTDNLGFTIDLGSAVGGNQAFVGRGGGNLLPAGRYKLGTYSITVKSVPAYLSILSTGALSPDPTSFGTACLGGDFDNTYKLGSDWDDVCGTSSTSHVEASTWGAIKALYR